MSHYCNFYDSPQCNGGGILRLLFFTKNYFVFRFEEENLTRLSLSKKEKAAMRTSYTAGTLHGDLLAFSDVAVLDGGAQDGGKKKRKRQSAAKQGKKKGEKRKELMCDRRQQHRTKKKLMLENSVCNKIKFR